MSDTCPTCGQTVRVVGSDEGTMHYAPARSRDEMIQLAALALTDADAIHGVAHTVWYRRRAEAVLIAAGVIEAAA